LSSCEILFKGWICCLGSGIGFHCEFSVNCTCLFDFEYDLKSCSDKVNGSDDGNSERDRVCFFGGEAAFIVGGALLNLKLESNVKGIL
jgi:hypothetical protein